MAAPALAGRRLFSIQHESTNATAFDLIPSRTFAVDTLVTLDIDLSIVADDTPGDHYLTRTRLFASRNSTGSLSSDAGLISSLEANEEGGSIVTTGGLIPLAFSFNGSTGVLELAAQGIAATTFGWVGSVKMEWHTWANSHTFGG